MARTGRRRGSPDTRAAILTAARAAFGEQGYDLASVRAIAAAAGVDAALVHHYFGTKEKLFLACVAAPADPGEILAGALAGGADGLGERLLRAFLSVWDGPVTGPAALAVFRSGLGHDRSARMLREFLSTQILRRIRPDLAPEHAELRAALIASQAAGLVTVRYLLRLEPLASAPAEVVVAAVAPTLQRYLTGPLDLPAVP